MWRPVDVECEHCGATHEEWVEQSVGKPRPEHVDSACPECSADGHNAVVLSMPAKYMGERISCPMVYGGQCDTMGYKELHDLPDLPGQAEHSAKLSRVMSQLPDNASSAERKALFSEHCKDAPTSADYSTLFASPEYKAVEAANAKIVKENNEKRARAKAWKAGNPMNFRRDKCAGDPEI